MLQRILDMLSIDHVATNLRRRGWVPVPRAYAEQTWPEHAATGWWPAQPDNDMPQIDPGYDERSHTRRDQALQEAFSATLHSDAKPFTEKPFAADGLPKEPMLRWFRYGHLPQHLQSVSAPFAIVANFIADTQPRSPERTACLRKLLEAKDCAVRNAPPPED